MRTLGRAMLIAFVAHSTGQLAHAGWLVTVFTPKNDPTATAFGRIDPETGIVRRIAPSESVGGDLAYDHTLGMLYGLALAPDGGQSSALRLMSAAPGAWAWQEVGPTAEVVTQSGALAIDDAGTGFLLGKDNAGVLTNVPYTVNLSTGAATPLGPEVPFIATALTWHATTGSLIYAGIDATTGYIGTLDRDTGAWSHLAEVPRFISALTYSPEHDTLFGVTNITGGGGIAESLITIDPITGATADVAPLSRPVYLGSLAWVPIPTAGVATLALCGSAMMLRRRRA